MSDIELQQDNDVSAVEKLLDITFGVDRFEKAAYMYRQNVDAIASLSFVIHKEGELIATLRFWPIKIGSAGALILGPIAVKPELHGQGFGISLMKHGLEQALRQGHSRVVLVGDEEYYSKIGFSRVVATGIAMPGQDDESRLLAKSLIDDAFNGISGLISKG
jgi:predicted N-acetyltransferase YhbS